MAGRYGLQVTAVEVQPERHRAAEELTQRGHLEVAVSHVCADILGTGLSLEVPNCTCYKGLACHDDNLLYAVRLALHHFWVSFCLPVAVCCSSCVMGPGRLLPISNVMAHCVAHR